MVYNNFITRSFVSIIFLIIYFFLLFYKFEFVFYLITIIYFLIFIEVYNNFHKFKIFIYMYLIFSFIFFLLVDFKNINLLIFNLMIITIISFDIFSYIFGKIFGRLKILKFISPKKTLEGLVGGTIFSIIISLFYSIIFKININFYLLLLIFIFIFSAFIGDVIQSIFKRLNNLKNSSNFLPGHGGFFDRFDSFIFTLITYSLFGTLS